MGTIFGKTYTRDIPVGEILTIKGKLSARWRGRKSGKTITEETPASSIQPVRHTLICAELPGVGVLHFQHAGKRRENRPNPWDSGGVGRTRGGGHIQIRLEPRNIQVGRDCLATMRTGR